MPRFDFDLGVIGGGAAGLTLTAGAARLGVRTLLVERRPALGGDCLHYGCVPSKTLIASARAWRLMRRARDFGLPPVPLPEGPVDFAPIRERIRSVIAAIQHHDSVERFQGLGARVLFGQAAFLDPHTIRVGARTYSAARWAVATGSSPAVPPVMGLEGVDFLTNEMLFSLERLPEDLLILGGGPIAVEMAQALQRLGCRVTLVQRSARLLSGEDADLADTLQGALEAEGVRVLTGMTLLEAREEQGAKLLLARDAQGREFVLRAAALLVALGRSPNTAALDLPQAGVAFGPKGIPTDRRLRSNQRHIFALGDVTGQHLFTHAAGYEGGVVLANAVFRLPKRTDYTWLPRAVYTDPELAVMGRTEKELQAAGTPYSVLSEAFADNDRAVAEGAGQGRLKLLLDRRERVLGVQIVGPRAGDLLGEWVAVLNGRLRLSTLASAVHPYPTLAEINKRAAGSVLAPKLFGGLPRRVLKLLFRYRGAAPPDGTERG